MTAGGARSGMDLHEAIFGTMSGVGLLALSIGAFGVLDAFNKRNPAAKRVDWLIALYTVGVALNIVAYTLLPGVVVEGRPDGQQRRVDQVAHRVDEDLLARAAEPDEDHARAGRLDPGRDLLRLTRRGRPELRRLAPGDLQGRQPVAQLVGE